MNDINNVKGKYYTISYSFLDDEGELLGSSDMSGPFTFCIGAGDAIPGLEEHIIGKEQGTPFQFTISAEKAYGMYNNDLVRTVPKTAVAETIHLAVGLQLYINNEKVTIIEVNPDTITVDSNHPLAGKNLNFDVSILAIDDERPVAKESCGCGSGCGCS